MKKLLIVMFIVLGMLCSNANAYTFDGEFDPKNIFTYQVMEMESLGGNRVLASLKSETEPKFVIACLMQAQQGIVILAYAYLGSKNELKHFMFNMETQNYDEMLPDETTTSNLIKRLKMLHKFSDV